MLDLKIAGGAIIDGSGNDRFVGDVGIKHGRIVAIGAIDEPARETIDATGRIVAPGFIDVHTHYDAQIFWDPKLSPSCFHGVTTVIGGLCGFSVAPLTRDAVDYIMRMLARVEGMPLATLETALPWDWTSFGEYLDRIEGKAGINAGFFVGHSTIRRAIMGERAVGHEATEDEVARMCRLLDASIAEGALGFSSTIASNHNDAAGDPVPSRWASHAELLALGAVVKDHPGTGLELLPDVDFGPGIPDLIADLSIAGDRPVNWNAAWIDNDGDALKRVAKQLAVSDYARQKGGEVIALTTAAMPSLFVNFRAGLIFDSLPGLWSEIFKSPLAERIERFKSPETRAQLAADAARVPADSASAYVTRFDRYQVISTMSESNQTYKGRTIGEIAAEQGRQPLDMMLDIAIADDLGSAFMPIFGGDDPATFKARGNLWRDDRTLIGASDAGAHLDMIDSFAYSSVVLERGVREFGAITLEEAIRQMTERPARYMGLIDRGLIAEGFHADIVIFDEATVGRGKPYMRFDVPGDEARIYADAIGVDHVLVNGVPIVRNGEHSGALPGTVLRSGRDTRTVSIDALREDRVAEPHSA